MRGWEIGGHPELRDEDEELMNLEPDRTKACFNCSDLENEEMKNGETGEVMILNPTPGVNGMLTANKRLRTLSFHAEMSEPNL